MLSSISARLGRTSIRPIVIAASIAAILIFLTSSASNAKADSKPAGDSIPQITLQLEPYTPDGAMRLYTVPGGTSYWTRDLPIYQGDSVKLDVFVSTGADELQQLKVRLDNVLVANMNKAPWTTTLSSATLGEGYHFVEAWVQSSGRKPQFATNVLSFFVNPRPLAAPDSQPVTQVKGQKQILANGQVVTVPLEANAVNASARTPETPPIFSSASMDSAATVKLVLTNSVTSTVLDQNGPMDVVDPVVASIVPSAGSTAQRFAYVLQRGDQIIVPASKLYDADATRIRLQPRTATVPGLLPGSTTLWVWGVDSIGNYSEPVSVTVQVQAPTGG